MGDRWEWLLAGLADEVEQLRHSPWVRDWSEALWPPGPEDVTAQRQYQVGTHARAHAHAHAHTHAPPRSAH
jgi:hypothetical protein